MEATLEQRGGEEEKGLEPTWEQRVRWEEGGLASNLESERQGSSWVLSLSSLPCHPHCAQVLPSTTFLVHHQHPGQHSVSYLESQVFHCALLVLSPTKLLW